MRAWMMLLVPLAIGAVAGVPFGVYLLNSVDQGLLLLVLGCVMLSYCVIKLSPLSSERQAIGDIWGLPFGACSGALGGAPERAPGAP